MKSEPSRPRSLSERPFGELPLLNGGRTHWRDEPVRVLRCTNCKGWGTVQRKRPGPEGWVSCPDCDATGRLEALRANIAADRETFASGVRDDG